MSENSWTIILDLPRDPAIGKRRQQSLTVGHSALFILAWVYPTFPGDEGVILTLQAHRTNWLDDAVSGLSNLELVGVF